MAPAIANRSARFRSSAAISGLTVCPSSENTDRSHMFRVVPYVERRGLHITVNIQNFGALRQLEILSRDGTARWVGLGVIANNLVNTATFLNARAIA